MKHFYSAVLGMTFTLGAHAQVTQLSNNTNLELVTPISPTKTIWTGGSDSSIWTSEGTAATTIQISTTIKMTGGGIMLGNKYIFAGSNTANGVELFMTDGTAAGTTLLKDINVGNSSFPADFTLLNGIVYFTAITTNEGRELWRTDGTSNGTTLVKDINPGQPSSNDADSYYFHPFGNALLFAASGGTQGVELWKTDGTANGTVQVIDINTGADSSKPHLFHQVNNVIIFAAKNAANGFEIWRTDGQAGGTFLLKDINPGTGSSTELEFIPGFSIPVTNGFHDFGGKAFFNATNGTSTGLLYSTDGTAANTTLVKDVAPGVLFGGAFVINAVNFTGKFLFPVTDYTSVAEIWQSDGTPQGTTLFKSFYIDDVTNAFPILYKSFQYENGSFTDYLFQGNKIFMGAAGSAQEGYELWITDGTLANTKVVKDINTSGSGIISPTYLYTNNTLFFGATNGTQGDELWKSDGTANGTVLVKDINPNAPDSDPIMVTLHNRKIYFNATDGDSPADYDLYVVDGEFTPLPSKLGDFTVAARGADALLQWQTLQEINSDRFVVQRSSDGSRFDNIGSIRAAGESNGKRQYQCNDAGILKQASGTVYYRLQMVDKDGQYSYSRVVSIGLRPNTWKVTLLGNAPGTPLSLAITGATQEVKVTLTDLSGRRLFARNYPAANGTVLVQHPHVPAGVYHLTVTQGSESKTMRIIR